MDTALEARAASDKLMELQQQSTIDSACKIICLQEYDALQSKLLEISFAMDRAITRLKILEDDITSCDFEQIWQQSCIPDHLTND